MDPSAIIFVALAVAWAVYLIPKALEHHEESVRTRSVEEFSGSLRVLARREAVSRREARLVYGDDEAPPTRREQRKAERRQAKMVRREVRQRRRNQRRVAVASRLPVEPAARRQAAAQAARRRLQKQARDYGTQPYIPRLGGSDEFRLPDFSNMFEVQP